jgi:hypothetical protein
MLAMGLKMRGVDGMRLSSRQIESAIQSIRDGKVNEAARELFDFIEESVNRGTVTVEDVTLGREDDIPIDEYFAATQEVAQQYEQGTMPMTDEAVSGWIDEEAANDYEEETFDNVDNLPQYEQDITGFREGAEQQPSTERATGESAAGQEGAGVTEVTPGTDRNAPSQQEVEAKRREYESAQRKLNEAEDKLAKEQGQQADMFGDRGVQQGMFDPTDAKEILDPLRQKVKEAKAAYEQAQKEFENEQLRQQPELGLKESAKELADRIRSMRIANNQLYGGFLGLGVFAYNSFLTTVAFVIEGGGTITAAIQAGYEAVKPYLQGSKFTQKEIKSAIAAELQNLGIAARQRTATPKQAINEQVKKSDKTTPVSFRELYKRRVLAEKNMGAIISELQRAVAV